MKKYIVIIALFIAVSTAWAIHIAKFSSWDDLIKQSPEIFIARCTSTLDFISASNKTTVVIDGMFASDIEVVSVLKGESKLGLSNMSSQYWPYRGETFLVFANYQKDQLNSGYTAIESYRVVSLGHNFMTNELAGKTLDEQIQLVLGQRLKDLDAEMARNLEEKARLEQAFKKESPEVGSSNNVPPAIPKPKHNGGVSF